MGNGASSERIIWAGKRPESTIPPELPASMLSGTYRLTEDAVGYKRLKDCWTSWSGMPHKTYTELPPPKFQPCIARMIVPTGATVVIPNGDPSVIRVNGAVVDRLWNAKGESMAGGFGDVFDMPYMPDATIGTSRFNSSPRSICTSGIHMYRTHADAARLAFGSVAHGSI